MVFKPRRERTIFEISVYKSYINLSKFEKRLFYKKNLAYPIKYLIKSFMPNYLKSIIYCKPKFSRISSMHSVSALNEA